jgi:hypothetical protein
MNRRRILALFSAMVLGPARSSAAEAGRELTFEIDGDFGGASVENIRAVLVSAASTLWENCPNTRWELPGFMIHRSVDNPITAYEHDKDGRIVIGLNVAGSYWAQFAFQFAHEFCHALAGHSNDWKKTSIKGPKANQWFEESLCETASLFALRAMSKRWRTAPPYPNWRSFAPHLEEYVESRIAVARKAFNEPFLPWFGKEQASLRGDAGQREKNLNIALQLLPMIEAEPSGWEAVTFCNLGAKVPEKSLHAYFKDWEQNSPKVHHAFIRKLAKLFGIGIP